MLPFLAAKRGPGWMAVCARKARASTSRTSCAPVANAAGDRAPRFLSTGGRVGCLPSAFARHTAPLPLPLHHTAGERPVSKADAVRESRRAGRGRAEACAGASGHGRLPRRWGQHRSHRASPLEAPAPGGGRWSMPWRRAAGYGLGDGRLRRGKVPLAAIDIPERRAVTAVTLFESQTAGWRSCIWMESDGLLTSHLQGAARRARLIGVGADGWPTRCGSPAATARARDAGATAHAGRISTTGTANAEFGGMVVSAAAGRGPVYLAENLYIPVRAMDLAAVCDFRRCPNCRMSHARTSVLPRSVPHCTPEVAAAGQNQPPQSALLPRRDAPRLQAVAIATAVSLLVIGGLYAWAGSRADAVQRQQAAAATQLKSAQQRSTGVAQAQLAAKNDPALGREAQRLGLVVRQGRELLRLAEASSARSGGGDMTSSRARVFAR